MVFVIINRFNDFRYQREKKRVKDRFRVFLCCLFIFVLKERKKRDNNLHGRDERTVL